MEFVEFLKDSKKFTDLGAKIPKVGTTNNNTQPFHNRAYRNLSYHNTLLTHSSHYPLLSLPPSTPSTTLAPPHP